MARNMPLLSLIFLILFATPCHAQEASPEDIQKFMGDLYNRHAEEITTAEDYAKKNNMPLQPIQLDPQTVSEYRAFITEIARQNGYVLPPELLNAD